MPSWTAGYVSDIEYTPGFYREQTPAFLSFACLLNGFEPMPSADGLACCELGCGQGVTANLLAAANPASRFHAVDFNPAHIARGRAMATAAGLSNITFLEASFAALADSDLPPFDVVTLHGVYSWVGAETRRAIVAFLARHLKPGGLVYLTYNSLPGWTEGLPVQRLLHEVGTLVADRSDRKIAQAVAFARDVQAAGSPYLTDNDVFEHVLKTLHAGEAEYLAHEYLGENWRPMFHADVARELAPAKLAFVASGSLVENFPGLTLTPAQRDLLDRIGVPEVRETLKDFFMRRMLRKDVFVRGARRLPPMRQRALLRDIRLALVVPPARASLTVAIPGGEAALEPTAYGAIFAALAERPHSVGELLALPDLAGRTDIEAAEIAGILIGSAQAFPIADDCAPNPAAADAMRRLNHAIAEQAVFARGNTRLGLATPLLGTGVYASALECMMYLGVQSGLDDDPDGLAAFVWQPLAARGETLVKDGQPVEGDEANLAVLRERADTFLCETLPLWRRLGVL